MDFFVIDVESKVLQGLKAEAHIPCGLCPRGGDQKPIVYVWVDVNSVETEITFCEDTGNCGEAEWQGLEVEGLMPKVKEIKHLCWGWLLTWK